MSKATCVPHLVARERFPQFTKSCGDRPCAYNSTDSRYIDNVGVSARIFGRWPIAYWRGLPWKRGIEARSYHNKSLLYSYIPSL